ncbi:MAG: transposase [Deltaproteobacteria bacterium]|nr:transposase [Deltaproteobacteria bacterium]
MRFDLDIHHRRSVRLSGYDYSQQGAYFVTICVQNRECLLGKIVDRKMVLNEAGEIVQFAWNGLSQRFKNVTLDAFIIMPNHIHGIIMIQRNVGAGLALPVTVNGMMGDGMMGGASPAPTSLGDVVGAFKSISAIAVNRLLSRLGPLWQRNYYEHIIRDEDDLFKIRQYIADNPACWDDDENNPMGKGALQRRASARGGAF